tara:strand:+ start:1034 stop:1405 length:372 start_codon:yes stop_codon:yes gene_type:complete
MENLSKSNTEKLVLESLYKLERKLDKTILSLKLERETHVPDLMTRIRILPTVAVVGQQAKVRRFFDGDAQLFISVKYMPNSTDIMKSVESLSKMIKTLPGVKSVAVLMHNKNKITKDGKKLIF